MAYPIENQEIGGWANYPRIAAELAQPSTEAQLRDYLQRPGQLIARGNGKSYGDAALAPRVLSTLQLRGVLDFDAETGEIECAAGTLLEDILPRIVPAGWFLWVTPGIKSISVGGAIACDVHGKNHPAQGCFSRHLLSLRLMQADGSVLECSPERHPALFWQTCGGMGWTGVILSARFRLRKIHATRMLQRTLRAGDWQQLFGFFEQNKTTEYAAAWVDGLAKGRAFGRGAAFLAEHDPEPMARLRYMPPKTLAVPFFAPADLLNRFSIGAFNAWQYHKNRDGARAVDFDDYFYPLDRLGHWNRLYGRRGFVQYQFCLPQARAFDGIEKVLACIQRHGQAPFLTVLKRHGPRPPEAVHSFPIEGYSLALDFPRNRGIFELVRQLDDLVWDAGGKIYLAKDACSRPGMGRVPAEGFGADKFCSLLRERTASVSAGSAGSPSSP